MDNRGFYRYYPNQEGKYSNGNSWVINSQGNTGYEVDFKDSLITIIGDSYIEALMNPPECHQSVILKRLLPKCNFYSIARSGANFLEELLIANDARMYTKTSKFAFIVNHSDFLSLVEAGSDYSIDTNTNKIFYPAFNHKKVDTKYYISKYFKFPYYIYRKLLAKNTKQLEVSGDLSGKLSHESLSKVESMLRYLFKKYNTNNFIFICKPDTDSDFYKLLKKLKVRSTLLKTNNLKEWQHEYDAHWNCFGHEQAAIQIAEALKN